MKRHFLIVIALSAIAGAAGGAIATGVMLQARLGDTDTLIEEYYAVENAVRVSPHGLRVKMDKGVKDFILVDLRSAEEYNKEHVAGAVNIPAYSDPKTSAYGDVDRIAGAFRALPEGKNVIVYCYSVPCMTGRKIGKMLTENGIYVQHLGIGWNEWRYHWTLWNHEWEWTQTKAEDYIATGPEPGAIKKASTVITPCKEGEFGC